MRFGYRLARLLASLHSSALDSAFGARHDPAMETATNAAPKNDAERTVSAALLRLRLRNPFMAALALFARYEVTAAVPTAATDGRTIFINPNFWDPLSPNEQDGLLLHEVLHCALGHAWRRGVRNPHVWNIAADIVINGIILAEPGAALPRGGMRDLRLEKFGSEEVYELLQRDFHKLPPLQMADLLDAAPGEEREDGNTGIDTMRRVALQGHWRHALEQARTIARAQGGDAPAGLSREIDQLDPSRLDWRAVLWRYLIKTPCDFSGFDRRHLARGLYLDALEGEMVRVFVCVDTSGSVNDEQIRSFLSEVAGILRAYPHLRATLYYADTALHGPHELERAGTIPPAKGGGGTDFRAFFNAITSLATDVHTTTVAIYLTDGFGTFPEHAPTSDTLWVVTPGGLHSEKFPFGEVVRLTMALQYMDPSFPRSSSLPRRDQVRAPKTHRARNKR